MATRTLTTTFDSNKINSFRRAVVARDVEGVKEALANGINPATPITGGASPLIPLLYGTIDGNRAAIAHCKDIETFEKNTSAIVDLLIEAGLKVAEPGTHDTGRFDVLADQFYLCDNKHDASTVIIQAIYESLSRGESGYLPNLQAQMITFLAEQSIKSNDDLKQCLTECLNIMQSLHETVTNRLQTPRTKTELALVEQFSESLGYWKGPFPRPSMASLLNTYQLARTQEGKLVLSVNSGKQTKPSQSENTDKEQGDKKQVAGDPRFTEAMEGYVQKLEKRDPKEVLAEINADLIGLDNIKKAANQIYLRQQFDLARQVSGKPVTPQNHSALFLGNPGLGKTVYARKKAELLHAMGLCGPNYVEIGRENVVGGFMGHAENNMNALFQMADVIFIDEAYSLNDGRKDSGDFGKKVLDALVRAIENNPNLTVFMAGYPVEMDQLIAMNPGLSSRFSKRDHFDDMTNDQLAATLDLMLDKEGFSISDDARSFVIEKLDEARKTLGEKNFGNARLVRNIVRALPDVMAERMFGGDQKEIILLGESNTSLNTVTLADAKALDYTSVLGTRKAAAQTSTGYMADRPWSDPQRESTIGFFAKVDSRGMRH